MPMTSAESLKAINDFRSLVAYLRDELEWEIPDDLSYDQLTYSYTADELGLELDAQVEITQLRPILGQQNPWGVFFVDFDKAELPVTLLRRILSSVSRRKRESANAGDRALFDKNDLLFVSAFGKADERRLALAHFHQEPQTASLPTLRVLAWDRHDTQRHMDTVAERLARLRWPGRGELPEAWKSRWSNAFIDRPRAAISTSKDLAAALATCAKQIREAIQEILPKERPGQPLSLLFEAVKATLNKDLDAAKFADTYAQTIAYGLLSKRIDQIQRWRAEKKRTLNGELPRPLITVDALETAIPTNPFLSELLNSFLAAGGRDRADAKLDFDELGLGDVVDLLNTANMEAVLDDFDKDKQGDDPVIHFYEGFLAAYDKAMKVQRGVFYTPKPVVAFIVRSVDEALRKEFGLPLGLADTTTWGQFVEAHPGTKIPQGAQADDPFVKILDPATGTGTFLVEAIDLIHRRMTDEAWKSQSVAEKEVLWNAYVSEHLLPRLYGYELMMAPYAVAHMKIGLKLADTGYDFSGTEAGLDGRARPTRARVFLTNALEPVKDLDMQLAFMSEALAHEARDANDAKAAGWFTAIVGNPPYAKSSSNRAPWAEELVQSYKVAVAGEQNVQPLSDDYIKFVAKSVSLIPVVGVVGLITNRSYLDGLIHRGMRSSLANTFSAIKIIDLHGDSNVGEAPPPGRSNENVFDIQQGVAILLLERRDSINDYKEVKAVDIWGSRNEKFTALPDILENEAWRSSNPSPPNYFYTRNEALSEEGWLGVNELFLVQGMGLKSRRDEFLIDIDKTTLAKRIEQATDASIAATSRAERLGLTQTDAWNLTDFANLVAARGLLENLRPIAYRPYDRRFIWYDRAAIERGDARWPVMQHLVDGGISLVTSRQHVQAQFTSVNVTTGLVEMKNAESTRGSYVFPLEIQQDRGRVINIDVRRLGQSLKVQSSRDILSYILAILCSPSYRSIYADILRVDFPKIPCSPPVALVDDLIPLGARLIALHLLDVDALPDLLADPKVRFVSNGGEPSLGRFNKEVRRDASGRVYLNDQNWFATVPKSAWEHGIGGYLPAQKWLKDRCETGAKDKLKPGRLLTDEDILHYRRMIVALEETAKVMAEIDEVIARHGGWPAAFRGMTDGAINKDPA